LRMGMPMDPNEPSEYGLKRRFKRPNEWDTGYNIGRESKRTRKESEDACAEKEKSNQRKANKVARL